MNARNATHAVLNRFNARGISISFQDANTLRKAELTLQRWAELECGDGNDYQSWAIERDEQTGKPYMVYYRHDRNEQRREKIADREAGALRRVADVCKRNNLHFFHQTDPRGCALYVSNEPLTDSAYTNGVSCCA